MQHPPARIVGDEGDFDRVLPVNQDRVPPVGFRGERGAPRGRSPRGHAGSSRWEPA